MGEAGCGKDSSISGTVTWYVNVVSIYPPSPPHPHSSLVVKEGGGRGRDEIS